MVVRRVAVAAHDVVFVKGLVEASEGLASLFSEHGGDLAVVAPLGRDAELNELLGDLVRDVGAEIELTHGSRYARALERGRAEEWLS
jgi:hypothetical protein